MDGQISGCIGGYVTPTRALHLSQTHGVKIPVDHVDLSYNGRWLLFLSAYSSIQIQTLNLTGTYIVPTPLTLPSLQVLNLSQTNVDDDILAILTSALIGLVELVLSRTNVKTLEGLSRLTYLSKLDISRTKVKVLFELAKLPLKVLNLSHTPICGSELLHLPATLECIILAHVEITERDLRHFTQSLKTLFLHNLSWLTDAGCAEIKAHPLVQLNIGNTQVTDVGMSHLSTLQLRHLTLVQNQITDNGLVYLANMPLTRLTLDHIPITDEGLRHLAQLKLEYLRLKHVPITDAGLIHCADIPITCLCLVHTEITGKGFSQLNCPLQELIVEHCELSNVGAYFAKFTSLERLVLSYTRFNNTDLLNILNLSLHSLKLDHTKVNGDIFIQICGLLSAPLLKSLKYLDLSGLYVTNKHMIYFADFPLTLHTLILAGTKIDDEGVQYLNGFEGLKHVDMSNTRITDSGVKSLVSLNLDQLDLRLCRHVTNAEIPLTTLDLTHTNISTFETLPSTIRKVTVDPKTSLVQLKGLARTSVEKIIGISPGRFHFIYSD